MFATAPAQMPAAGLGEHRFCLPCVLGWHAECIARDGIRWCECSAEGCLLWLNDKGNT